MAEAISVESAMTTVEITGKAQETDTTTNLRSRRLQEVHYVCLLCACKAKPLRCCHTKVVTGTRFFWGVRGGLRRDLYINVNWLEPIWR